MCILITGVAGFIGSHLADALLERGELVIGLDNFTTGSQVNLPEHKNFVFEKGSIVDTGFLETIFEKYRPEVVVHAAASYRNPYDWLDDINNNIIGTVNIIRCCQSKNVKKVIYYQTSLCYGTYPISNPITLSHPLFANTKDGGSSYAITKTAGELYLAQSGLNFMSFRLANVYGPRNLSGPIPNFFKKILSNEKCLIAETKRDFINISDVVDCTLKAIDKSCWNRRFLHIATGEDRTILDVYLKMKENLAPMFLHEAGYSLVKKGVDDVDTILLDPSETEDEFSWKAKIEFTEGLKLALDWYKKNELFSTYTHLKM